MDLPAIVRTGRPDEGIDHRPVFRRVDPPQKVVVDLAVLFPRQPFHDGRVHPDGLRMRARAAGKLTMWGMCTDGAWWGLVTYSIQFGEKRRTVTHWIPSWILLKT